MEQLFFDANTETLTDALKIPEERWDDLQFSIRLIIHNLHTPTRNGVIEFNDAMILDEYLKLANTEAERVLLAFMAGRASMELCHD